MINHRQRFLIATALVFGTILVVGVTVAMIISTPTLKFALAEQMQVQNTTTNNNTTTSSTSNVTGGKPVDGYNKPEGHLTAIRHVFDYPSLRVQHYCKPNDKILLVCQLYDSSSSNATLIGIEYIISADQVINLYQIERNRDGIIIK